MKSIPAAQFRRALPELEVECPDFGCWAVWRNWRSLCSPIGRCFARRSAMVLRPAAWPDLLALLSMLARPGLDWRFADYNCSPPIVDRQAWAFHSAAPHRRSPTIGLRSPFGSDSAATGSLVWRSPVLFHLLAEVSEISESLDGFL